MDKEILCTVSLAGKQDVADPAPTDTNSENGDSDIDDGPETDMATIRDDEQADGLGDLLADGDISLDIPLLCDLLATDAVAGISLRRPAAAAPKTAGAPSAAEPNWDF